MQCFAEAQRFPLQLRASRIDRFAQPRLRSRRQGTTVAAHCVRQHGEVVLFAEPVAQPSGVLRERDGTRWSMLAEHVHALAKYLVLFLHSCSAAVPGRRFATANALRDCR